METVIFHDGRWYEDENPHLMGPLNQAFWLSTIVFDGARAFGGLTPDLDQHCGRVLSSARTMMMEPTLPAGEIADLCRQAVRKFPKDAELYIRPMFWAADGFLVPDPASTTFALAVYRSPLPDFSGMSVCLSSRRRPARDMAPTDAKASCLYPNTARALKEAMGRGYDNCIVLDPNGNVAEIATANLWIVRDGVAMTPAANGTFLAGVTRGRVGQLLRDAGVEVRECTLTMADVLEADEVFSTGNYGKVVPITRVEQRDLQSGPVTRKARDLYWEYAAASSVF